MRGKTSLRSKKKSSCPYSSSYDYHDLDDWESPSIFIFFPMLMKPHCHHSYLCSTLSAVQVSNLTMSKLERFYTDLKLVLTHANPHRVLLPERQQNVHFIRMSLILLYFQCFFYPPFQLCDKIIWACVIIVHLVCVYVCSFFSYFIQYEHITSLVSCRKTLVAFLGWKFLIGWRGQIIKEQRFNMSPKRVTERN